MKSRRVAAAVDIVCERSEGVVMKADVKLGVRSTRRVHQERVEEDAKDGAVQQREALLICVLRPVLRELEVRSRSRMYSTCRTVFCG